MESQSIKTQVFWISVLLLLSTNHFVSGQAGCYEPKLVVPDTLRSSDVAWAKLVKTDSCVSNVSYSINKITYMVFKGTTVFKKVTVNDTAVPGELISFLTNSGYKILISIEDATKIEYGTSEPIHLSAWSRTIRTIF